MKDPASAVVIEPESGLFDLGLAELYDFRELFLFLVWREIRGRYAQSVLGVGWAIIQPLMAMVVFTVIFGNLAEIDSDGIPYSIFSFSALVAWTYYSDALSDSTTSLVSNANMLQKTYFPRLILPLSAILARMVDFLIAFTVLLAMMAWFRIPPTWWALGLPVLLLLLMMSAAGMGMFLGALAVQYRDVKHAMSFMIKFLMYAAPVVYPVSYIPEEYRLLYAVNPMVGVVEGFRASLLGTTPMPWDLIGVGAVSAVAIFALGTIYFRRKEHLFADVG